MSKGGPFEVAVTFEERRGYVGSAPELCQPVVALSLGGLPKIIALQPFPTGLTSRRYPL